MKESLILYFMILSITTLIGCIVKLIQYTKQQPNKDEAKIHLFGFLTLFIVGIMSAMIVLVNE